MCSVPTIPSSHLGRLGPVPCLLLLLSRPWLHSGQRPQQSLCAQLDTQCAYCILHLPLGNLCLRAVAESQALRPDHCNSSPHSIKVYKIWDKNVISKTINFMNSVYVCMCLCVRCGCARTHGYNMCYVSLNLNTAHTCRT